MYAVFAIKVNGKVIATRLGEENMTGREMRATLLRRGEFPAYVKVEKTAKRTN